MRCAEKPDAFEQRSIWCDVWRTLGALLLLVGLAAALIWFWLPTALAVVSSVIASASVVMVMCGIGLPFMLVAVLVLNVVEKVRGKPFQ